MSRITINSAPAPSFSLPSDSASLSSAIEVDPKTALGHQIDRLQNRKDKLKQNAQIPPEKVQELELFMLELGRLFEMGDMEAAALLYVKCVAFAEEPERLSPVPILIVSAPITDMEEQQLTTFSIGVEPLRFVPNEQEQIGRNEGGHGEDNNIRRNGGMSGSQRRRSLWKRITGRGRRPIGMTPDERDGVRDLWGTQMEFFLSCLGFIVGGGNTLRFPAMIFEFGGAFFIPYLFFLVIFGLPLVYMHLAIGQYSGLSASGAFYKMMPIASGLGWALVLLAVPVSIYYIFYVAWGFYYLWFSLHGLFITRATAANAGGGGLIWEHCRPKWVQRFNCCELSEHCFSIGDNNNNNNNAAAADGHATTPVMSSTEAFFHFQVLNRTLNFQVPTLGPIQEHLVVSLMITWIVVFFGVFKGLGSIGWAVSITATVPYFLLIILLLRSISLKGSSTGLVYLFMPEIDKLWCLRIWQKAAEQVFYSLGIDAGPLISMASFSRFRNNIYRDAVLLVLIDTMTSVLCGMVIFAFIGFMTTSQGININDIQKLDPTYIAFTVYPGVTAYLEWGFVWAILFFTILTLSAVDVEFAWLEMIASSIMNLFGSKLKSTENRLLILLCVFCCLCGIPLCTRGGIYIFHAIENLNSNWNSFSLSLVQVLIVCYFYGVDRFLEDIAEMLRVQKPPCSVLLSGMSREQFWWSQFRHFFGPCGGYIKWMWSLFAPIVLTLLLLASVWGYERVHFNKVELPIVFELIAWIAMTGPLLAVPGIAIWNVVNTIRHHKPLKLVFSAEQWRNRDSDEQSKQPKHPDEGKDLYAYIDPLSRGASAKSNRNVRMSARLREMAMEQQQEDNYLQLRERLKRWENNTGMGGEGNGGNGQQQQTSQIDDNGNGGGGANRTIGRGSNLTDRPELVEEEDEEEQKEQKEEEQEEEEELRRSNSMMEDENEGESDERMRGRIKDWEAMAAVGQQQRQQWCSGNKWQGVGGDLEPKGNAPRMAMPEEMATMGILKPKALRQPQKWQMPESAVTTQRYAHQTAATLPTDDGSSSIPHSFLFGPPPQLIDVGGITTTAAINTATWPAATSIILEGSDDRQPPIELANLMGNNNGKFSASFAGSEPRQRLKRPKPIGGSFRKGGGEEGEAGQQKRSN